jgi:hypothetical protein
MFPKYTLSTLETHAIDLAKARELEMQYRKADLLYALFTDAENERTKKLIGLCLSSMEKKNETTLKDSKMFQEGVSFLRSEFADPTICVFVFLLILARDADVQKTVRNLYRPGNPWGDACQVHFDAFINGLINIANQLMTWPVSEPNIVPTVRNFVRKAHETYMTTHH